MDNNIKNKKLRMPDVVSVHDVATYLIAFGVSLRNAYTESGTLLVTFLDRAERPPPSSRSGDVSREWMDEHLMSGGICACKFPSGTMCMSVQFGGNVAHAVRASDKQEKFDHCQKQLESRIVKMEGASIGEIRRVLIPITDGGHYGVACIEGYEGGLIAEGYRLWWGDSLGIRNPSGYKKVLVEVCRRVWPRARFVGAMEANYMTDHLGWERQRKGWECGVYAVMLVRHFAVGSDYLPMYDFREYDCSLAKYYNIKGHCRDAFIAGVMIFSAYLGTALPDDMVMRGLYTGVPITYEGRDAGERVLRLQEMDMNWLGRTKIPRRTRPVPPSSE